MRVWEWGGRVLLSVALPLVAACGAGEDASPMAGMTAAEHARMQAGGTAGAVDAEGVAARQAVALSGNQERALGVVLHTVSLHDLDRAIRTVGVIEPAESRIAEVTPKIEGFVERLAVSTTGEPVRRGQVLLTLYSPVLVAAQEELLTARRLVERLGEAAGAARGDAEAALEAARWRLAYWDITEDQIRRLEETGEVTKTLAFVSPVSGIVLEKSVLQGQRVMPGQPLYRIADLSDIWVEGNVFEQDIRFIHEGQRAHIEVAAYPGEHLMGSVSFIHPVVNESSRTNRIRVTLPNRDLRLKPGMFATIFFDAVVGRGVVAVPREAVIVTGERNLVFVRDEEGTLHPREVVLGPQAERMVQILAGLEPGEVIVGSANFLVDAESRLAGSGAGMPGMQHAGHGSVIEPANDSAPSPTTEHSHD